MNTKEALAQNMLFDKKRESPKVEQKYMPHLKGKTRLVKANTLLGRDRNSTTNKPYSVATKIYGCDGCIWRCSKFCPHSELNGGQVTFSRAHSNRICSHRKNYMYDKLVETVGKEGLSKIGTADEMVFRDIMDDAFIANYRKNAALRSGEEVDFKIALDWSKHSSDIKLRWLKHKEGSKVQIERKVTPADLADLMDKAKIVETEVIDND